MKPLCLSVIQPFCHKKIKNENHISSNSSGFSSCKESGNCFFGPTVVTITAPQHQKTITLMLPEFSASSQALMYPDCVIKTICL